VYNRTIVDAGTHIVLARDRFVRALAQAARNAHARFTGGSETLELRYAPNVPFEAPTADAVSAALSVRLAQVAESERVRKTSVAGPHRDDLTLELDGNPLAMYGSQGQQRTAVLALKVAEYAVMRERAAEAPLLLLDDVLSELDEERAAAFLATVGDYEQAFVTATHWAAGLDAGAHLYGVSEARVLPGSAVA